MPLSQGRIDLRSFVTGDPVQPFLSTVLSQQLRTAFAAGVSPSTPKMFWSVRLPATNRVWLRELLVPAGQIQPKLENLNIVPSVNTGLSRVQYCVDLCLQLNVKSSANRGIGTLESHRVNFFFLGVLDIASTCDRELPAILESRFLANQLKKLRTQHQAQSIWKLNA